MKVNEDAVPKIEEQVELYQELLEVLKKENQLLTEDKDVSDLQEQKREIKDEIADINTELNVKFTISQGDKLRVIMNSDSEKLNQLKPTLEEVYELEQKNQQALNAK
ncbi:hypothetical protein [Acetohalobium arabaticum]|uniref:Uncharacterized protein n=1 Tax=Acetohalobium arabaticum (strain ATCC 49924 / DSM 5501 / Z-7288) TaxID=574087 RepID=D9QTP9_ACEAZ|nr:hypothetical protein [Acetohalobium arabaticum]ADL11813.1 conserved hypothetical protein [Acetohalobium arabaticum DSM 5501]